jgi:hypothetical protein
MSRLWLGFAFLLLASSAAVAEPVLSCQRPRTELDRLTCQYPDLEKSAREVAKAHDQLRQHYSGEERHAFDVEYEYWRKNRATACLGPDGGLWDKDGKHGCLKKYLDERLGVFNTLATHSKTVQAVVIRYSAVDVSYLKALPREFEGVGVGVWGVLSLDGCYKDEPPHSGRIFQENSRISLEFRFDGIDKASWNRLCDNPRGGPWTGTVMLDHGRPYLYVPKLFG